jgi:hypothetical protein
MEKHNEPIEEQLKRLSKLNPDTGCFVWIGSRSGRYGAVRIPPNRQEKAHIVAWECIYGPRPEGFIIQHTCRNPLCVNIRHLVLFKSSGVDSRDDIKRQLDRLKRRIIINPKTGCWEWQGSTAKGYGRLRVGKRYVLAHRLMWECVYGETNNLHILHKCDNRSCICPSHLFLGTNADNMRDKVLKDRAGIKLNIKEVKDIRTSKLAPKDLAKKYGVRLDTIYRILNRETWKHIE